MSSEAELDDDQVLVVLQAGEDHEGALVVSIVGVYTDPENLPENTDQMHRSILKVFVDADLDEPVPAMRFQPTQEVLSNMERAEAAKQKMMEKRKKGDYS